MAGEVAAVGVRVTRFAAGDRVMALVGGGAQAELAVVYEAHALPVPAGLSWPEAGGFMEVVRDRVRRPLRTGGPHAR